MKYYALVCDELPARQDACLRHLCERGVLPTLWKAFHGLTWGLETSKEYEQGKRIPPGHVALNLSSWAMWAYAKLRATDADEPTLFLEDDAVLPDNWDVQLPAVLDELQEVIPDWDLVFLGLCDTEPAVWHKVTERLGKPDSRLCRLSDPFGTHALLVRPRAIPVLLENMKEARCNLDQQLWQNVLRPGKLKWCAVLPTLIKQRTFDYTGGGRPEWGPSCLRPEDTPPPGATAAASEDADGRPSAQTYHATLALVDPYPCAYRGEPYNEHARDDNVRRSVPVNECAVRRQPCHNRPMPISVTHPSGQEVAACQTCDKRKDMSPAPRLRDRLPLPEGHFNPSMVLWRDRLILATRDSWGHSKVGLWELKNSHQDWTGAWAVTPLASLACDHPEAPRLEDPRLFVDPRRDELCCTWNLPDNYPPKVVRIGYGVIKDDMSRIVSTRVYSSPCGSVYEKNWEPFFHDSQLHWTYAAKPEHVILNSYGAEKHRTSNPLPWTGGVVRGGCPPVLKDGVFHSFYHGCLKRTFGNVYTIGCYTFEAKPPFRILRQTPIPLAWPDMPAAGEDVVKRWVLFPGGAVPHAGAWHLAVGIDDTFCRIIRLPFGDVEAALQDVPEADPDAVQSIRTTPIALGVRHDD